MTASLFPTGPVGRSASIPAVSRKDMRKSGTQESRGWVIKPQLWVDQWHKLHPVKPAQCVAEAIDAPVRTVEKWFAGEAKPSLDYVGPILNRYGLGFVVGAMAAPLPWLDDLAREERKRKLLAERQAIDAMLEADWRRAQE